MTGSMSTERAGGFVTHALGKWRSSSGGASPNSVRTSTYFEYSP
jgi:hypothetical protein